MCDLLVIGPGRLGLLIAQGWKRLQPSSKIFLKFRSEDEERSRKLMEDGFLVVLDENIPEVDRVVFCAPPTGNPHYAKDVEDGFKYLKSEGLLVFTSSGSVFSQNNGETVNEESSTTRTERSTPLLDAEDVVLQKGGCVLRLGGLYSLESGAHNFYDRGGDFNVKADGILTWIHYQDAAEAVLCCLGSAEKVRGEVLLAGDGVPASRAQILAAARSCSLYSGGGAEVRFTGGEGVDGKKYDCSKLRSLLHWTPQYPSFVEFMANQTHQTVAEELIKL